MTMNSQPSTPDVVALRPFVPAKDFEKSLQFYVDLGFSAHRLGDSLASMELGSFGFPLSKFDVKGFSGNFMMQMMGNYVAGWWKGIESLDLPGETGGKPHGGAGLPPC